MGTDSDMEPTRALASRARGLRLKLGGTRQRLGLCTKASNETDSHLAPVCSEEGIDYLLSTCYVFQALFLNCISPPPHTHTNFIITDMLYICSVLYT